MYILMVLFCCDFVVNFQGRNFGVKMGVLIQKENETPLGPEAREEENGEQVSPPHSTHRSERVS